MASLCLPRQQPPGIFCSQGNEVTSFCLPRQPRVLSFCPLTQVAVNATAAFASACGCAPVPRTACWCLGVGSLWIAPGRRQAKLRERVALDCTGTEQSDAYERNFPSRQQDSVEQNEQAVVRKRSVWGLLSNGLDLLEWRL